MTHVVKPVCEWSYLNLGLSLVTTPISSSLALKSTDRTEDRQEMANWKDRKENAEKILQSEH